MSPLSLQGGQPGLLSTVPDDNGDHPNVATSESLSDVAGSVSSLRP